MRAAWLGAEVDISFQCVIILPTLTITLILTFYSSSNRLLLTHLCP